MTPDASGTSGQAVTSIDVVIPVFDRADRIGEAVRSVLAQATPPDVTLGVILVDDGSTDRTPTTVAALARKHAHVSAILLDHNQGPSAARNAAIRQSGASHITFLDSDDLMLPGRLVFQVARLTESPVVDAVTGLEVLEVQPGVVPPPWVQRLPPVDVAPRHYVMSMLVGRHHLLAVGGFDATIRVGEDFDLMVRLRDTGVRFAHEEQEVVVRRIFGDNLIYDDEGVQFTLLRAVRGQIGRARIRST